MACHLCLIYWQFAASYNTHSGATQCYACPTTRYVSHLRVSSAVTSWLVNYSGTQCFGGQIQNQADTWVYLTNDTSDTAVVPCKFHKIQSLVFIITFVSRSYWILSWKWTVLFQSPACQQQHRETLFSHV